jgi:hypothetical protein
LLQVVFLAAGAAFAAQREFKSSSVTDTETGLSRTYMNPAAFQAITDTSAFATCP